MTSSEPTRLKGLTVPVGSPTGALRRVAAEALGVPVDAIGTVRPVKVSLDARGNAPKHIYTADVWRTGEEVPEDTGPRPRRPATMRPLRVGEAPIIVGTGPAGLWAALGCVEAGQPVVMLDRGPAVDARNRAVVGLRRRGVLDPESNLCFGEGGAGTYSDGKLYTRVKDPRVRRVYEDLVAFGAPQSLLIDAHPHVGTNLLIRLLRRLRAFLIEAGCEVRFHAKVTDLLVNGSGRVDGVRLEDGEEITGSSVILATGHSARGVYEMLHRRGAQMARKPLAIGARVEHPQALINDIQLGAFSTHPELDAATYAVTAKISGRGIYSFCMCPGGYVIPTPTEPNHLNVNGMSNSNRGSRWANSALVVTVEPEDFWITQPGDLDAHGPLAGLALQRHLEQRAYQAGGGGYIAPAQRLTDFLSDRVGDLPGRSSYKPGLVASDLRQVLPRRLSDPISRAVHRFDERMRGFLSEEAVLIGVETTTSSPIRVLRHPQNLTSPSLPGLYPCGEGAGFAGGIVSSAIDGLKVAEAVTP
jgi:uncharacterized FAD-dependent dehydrogenase